MALFSRLSCVVIVVSVLSVLCASLGHCQGPPTAPPGTSLPLGMPDQMKDALQVIIPCPTSSNAVLIDDQQRSALLDLPGRLVVLKGSPYIPATSLMQNYRKPDAAVKMETGPAKPPVRATQFECSEERGLSFLSSWFGFDVKKSKKCLVELRATPAPTASMSTTDLNVETIQSELIDKLPLEKRLCLGIIVSVTPYEVLGALGTLESKPSTLGVWYLKMDRDWYRKTQDEQRLYYLVAVYVPPITPEEALLSISPGSPKPAESGLIDEKMLSAWLKENKQSLPKFTALRTLPNVAIVNQASPED